MTQKNKTIGIVEGFGLFSSTRFGSGFAPAALGFALAFAVTGGNIDGYKPDTAGTAQAHDVTAAHKTQFGELKILELERDRLQLENSLRGSGHDTAPLESAFNAAADDVLHSLYTRGMDAEEAAIPEKTFAALHRTLTTSAPGVLSRAGLHDPGTDGAGALDECLADLSAANSGAPDMKALNACMIEKKPNPALFFGTVLGFPFLYILCGAFARRYAGANRDAPPQKTKLRHGPH